ncbi:MAG TPA: tRNA (adenosine(37)-N6)-threonylcarbamoyltransferase complex dimerization subunit type 1 TsaB [Clostridiaceae bacterium]|nr:tRNA (adenosine(37)-N6)-threonylcarbamoyltransferase complex dimerization subunit type 1 TsaB [Clostridiaceae bacterium]
MKDTSKYILAIDSSGSSLSVALLENHLIRTEKFLNISNQHSVNLLPALDSMMQEVEKSYDDLSAVAVTVGPGSFTGIRIGVSTANTMAYGLDIPVVGISALEALAFPYRNQMNIILPVFDARGGRLYGAFFRQGKRITADQQFVDRDLPELVEEQFLNRDSAELFFNRDFKDQLQNRDSSKTLKNQDSNQFSLEKQSITILGDGFMMAQTLLAELDLRLTPRESVLTKQDYISASSIGYLAWEILEKNSNLYEKGYIEPVKPNYCVITQAERNLAKKKK